MLRQVTILLAVFAAASAIEQFREIFRWNTMDIVWPSEEIRTKVMDRNEYIPENNAIAGIKFWRKRMFLTIPRLKHGVPITLGVVPAEPQNRDWSPKVEAYPSWDMQAVGDCSALQFVQSMEIDTQGRMWILDTGRTATMTTEAKSRCPPRLVIVDIEKNGEVLRSHTFPESVTSYDKVLLNDIVLDHTDGGYAYISDTSETDPGLIVFSLSENTSWKIRHDSMKPKSEAIGFSVARTWITSPIPIDGIALSPVDVPQRYVYYSPLSAFNLYAIPTSVLKNNTQNVDSFVRDIGRKSSQTDGMMMSATGVLYFGLLADDAVAMWDTKNQPSFVTGQRIISRDHVQMQWPDTFGFDEEGNLWCVTNSLQNFINNKVDPTVANYRVIRISTGTKSYQYHEDGTAPPALAITAGAADRVAMAMATLLIAVLTLALK
ncbi:protein yellow-like [Microplitis mediator]|uniref:protein yellow-like n=1 Tax=Microplitis mediator TaxID=375433 RepID=UPI002552CF76|nr:protein yellow-like [Microplitis mediator]